jgi:WD40 repeat protein
MGKVGIADLQQFRFTQKFRAHYIVEAATISPNSRILATAGMDDGEGRVESLKFWRVGSEELISTITGFSSAPVAILFCGANEVLVLSLDGTVTRCGLGGKKDALRLRLPEVPLVAGAIDNNRLFLVHKVPKEGIQAISYDISSDREVEKKLVPVPEDGVSCVAFSRDHKLIAAVIGDPSLPQKDIKSVVKVWDLDSTKEVAVLEMEEPGAITCAEFGVDSNIVAFGKLDGTVRLWDHSKNKRPILLKGHDSRVEAITLSKDGKLLASADPNTIIVWDWAKALRLSSKGGQAPGGQSETQVPPSAPAKKP